MEAAKIKENDEKQKLKNQLNQEKKLTEEVIDINNLLRIHIVYCIIWLISFQAVKKLYQIVQEKKPKTGVLKNASETKRLEKEHKRLQMEVNKV